MSKSLINFCNEIYDILDVIKHNNCHLCKNTLIVDENPKFKKDLYECLANVYDKNCTDLTYPPEILRETTSGNRFLTSDYELLYTYQNENGIRTFIIFRDVYNNFYIGVETHYANRKPNTNSENEYWLCVRVSLAELLLILMGKISPEEVFYYNRVRKEHDFDKERLFGIDQTLAKNYANMGDKINSMMQSKYDGIKCFDLDFEIYDKSNNPDALESLIEWIKELLIDRNGDM